MRNEDITTKFKELKASQTSLDEKAQELIPLILTHFNDYIDQNINTVLPEGYSLAKSTLARYNGNGFIINGESIQKEDKNVEVPTTYEREIMGLC